MALSNAVITHCSIWPERCKVMLDLTTPSRDSNLILYRHCQCVASSHQTEHNAFRRVLRTQAKRYQIQCLRLRRLCNASQAPKKLSDRSKRVIFVGISSSQKGWKLYDPSTRKTNTFHHVQFHEESFTQLAEEQPKIAAESECELLSWFDPVDKKQDSVPEEGDIAEIPTAPKWKCLRLSRPQ
jgi:hypothetical protein